MKKFRKAVFQMITNEYVTFTIGKKKNIALIAHDLSLIHI